MFSERTTLQKLLLLKALSVGGQSLVERTAIGNPLTFGTDVSKPLKSLLIPFTPQQEGTGDPSPQNIRTILPLSGLTVFGGGKNLLNPAKYVFNTITSRGLTFEVQSDGSVKVTGTTESSDFGPTLSVRFQLPAGTYYGYRDDGNVYVAYRKSTSEEGGVTTGLVSPFTLDGSEWVYCNIYVRNSGTFDTIIHPQIARENAQSSYEPYKPITDTDIPFPSPVYGGTLDVVSGVLTVEWVKVVLNGTEEWSTVGSSDSSKKYYMVEIGEEGYVINSHIKCDKFVQTAISSSTTNTGINVVSSTSAHKSFISLRPNIEGITDSDSLKTWLSENNVTAVYELATPQEIQLTPAQITALLGNNTIWSDADGSMTAVYLVSSKYAEEHPVGGLGSGLGSGLLGSGTEDNPEDPIEDPSDELTDDPEEEIPDNTEEGSEPDD